MIYQRDCVICLQFFAGKTVGWGRCISFKTTGRKARESFRGKASVLLLSLMSVLSPYVLGSRFPLPLPGLSFTSSEKKCGKESLAISSPFTWYRDRKAPVEPTTEGNFLPQSFLLLSLPLLWLQMLTLDKSLLYFTLLYLSNVKLPLTHSLPLLWLSLLFCLLFLVLFVSSWERGVVTNFVKMTSVALIFQGIQASCQYNHTWKNNTWMRANQNHY